MHCTAIATVAITNVVIPTVANRCKRCHKNRSKPTIAIATVLIATVAIETIAIVTVAITTVAIANVNLTTFTIATVIRSFKVLLRGVMIDSKCMADCYPPVAVKGGGGGLGYFKSS